MALETRDYQQRIIGKALDTYRAGGKSVLIESPAGSGKTVMGFSIASRIVTEARRLFNKDPRDVSIGWVAMRRNLLVQAKAENEEKLGVDNVHYISMFDKEPPKVDLLVIDEAQHDAANSARHVFKICQPTLSLGLSATPYRTDRMQLCFDKVIKDAGYRRLIQEGWLSPYDQYTLNEYTVSSVTKAYLRDRERWGKTMMFFHRVDDCVQAAKILSEHGVRCEVVTATSDRFAQIDAFEAGMVDVLINVYVLTEGFDCPDMKTVFVRDSSKGPTIQMSGRVLRKHPDIPVVNIVQSTNTRWPFVKIASCHKQYIQSADQQWLSVGTNDKLDDIRLDMLIRLAKSKTSMPKFITRATGQSLREARREVVRLRLPIRP